MHTLPDWPGVVFKQSLLVMQAAMHRPEKQTSPAAQSLLAVQVQRRVVWLAVHVAEGPHCASVAQVPQTPPTQTWPAAHWLFVMQPPDPGQPGPAQGWQV